MIKNRMAKASGGREIKMMLNTGAKPDPPAVAPSVASVKAMLPTLSIAVYQASTLIAKFMYPSQDNLIEL